MERVLNHPLYLHLNSLENLRIFMENHVFSVWTFMILLQNIIERLSPSMWVPPSIDSMEMLRNVREVWMDEETDFDWSGRVVSHMGLYIESMKEINASAVAIESVVDIITSSKTLPMSFLDTLQILPSTKAFITRHLALLDSERYSLDDVFTYFLYGRELIIPDMFKKIRSYLIEADVQCPSFMFYLERHIEVDLTHGRKLKEIFQHANESMIELARQDRIMLWDGIYNAILEKNRYM